ncbi:MAG: polysaccharide biosynthesis C-terminal domain-containing protein, partial [bacterium]
LNVPILIIFIIIAKPFVILLLTEKWAPMIPYLQLICVIGFVYPFVVVNHQLILAIGKSKLAFKINIISNSLRIINLVLMYRYGIIYIIFGEILIQIITSIMLSIYVYKFIDYSLLKQLYDIRKTLIFGLLSLLGGFLVNSLFNDLLLSLILSGGIVILLYVGLQYLFNHNMWINVINLKNNFNRK